MTVFEDYVDQYSDLLAAWENSGPLDFQAYVNNYSDLVADYQVNNNGRSVAQYGEDHFNAFGRGEGRTVPQGPPPLTKDRFGAEHWNDWGRNEARMLPGPKIGLNNNGTVSLTGANLIGSRLINNYRDVVSLINNSRPGEYRTLMESLVPTLGRGENLLWRDLIANDLIDITNASYTERNITPWDPTVSGAQPPVGAFNSSYYIQNTDGGDNARRAWNNARRSVTAGPRGRTVTLPDLDITARYGDVNNYAHWHYTTQGKAAGDRGNAPMAADEADGFQEVLTDYEKQLYRDQILGIVTDPTGEEKVVLSTPEFDEEGNLINTEELDTLLEQTFGQTLSAQDYQKEKQLGSLAQDLLKVSINELKKAKLEESNLGLMRGLPGYNDILNINTTLANSIIGDTGIGGILSLSGSRKEATEQIEKGIGEITGLSSNTTIYNWQKWFDETLLKRYEDYEIEAKEFGEEELSILQTNAKEEIDAYEKDPTLPKPIFLDIAEKYKEGDRVLDVNNIEDFKKIMFHIDMESKKEFVNNFIDGYLKPRFDQSKSMDEFISYLDVKEEEQNIFQSQTTINKLKEIANLRSRSFLDLLQTSETTTKNFDTAFYFDPVTNNSKLVGPEKLKQYELQRDIVEADFANASEDIVGDDGINWAIEAYRYGMEDTYKTNRNVFARLHYQAKGSTGAVTDAEGNPFLLDPAEDILPYQELEKKIKNFGVEMAARREFYGGAGFMKFVTPEEYADALLGSIDPLEDKESWDEILKTVGLEGEDITIEQVKEYLIEQLRTEEARNIRENIKYLNEQQDKINQQTLGVSYIERPEDVKEEQPKSPTALYTFFKNAGYGGTEDAFYTEFFPDLDRNEQELITKVGTNTPFESALSDATDPFKAFSTVSTLFADDENIETSESPLAIKLFGSKQEEETTSAEPSYFKIFESDEEVPEKSEAATSFLKEFTSMFKGFS
jgi:hypothetical protein